MQISEDKLRYYIRALLLEADEADREKVKTRREKGRTRRDSRKAKLRAAVDKWDTWRLPPDVEAVEAKDWAAAYGKVGKGAFFNTPESKSALKIHSTVRDGKDKKEQTNRLKQVAHIIGKAKMSFAAGNFPEDDGTERYLTWWTEQIAALQKELGLPDMSPLYNPKEKIKQAVEKGVAAAKEAPATGGKYWEKNRDYSYDYTDAAKKKTEDTGILWMTVASADASKGGRASAKGKTFKFPTKHTLYPEIISGEGIELDAPKAKGPDSPGATDPETPGEATAPGIDFINDESKLSAVAAGKSDMAKFTDFTEAANAFAKQSPAQTAAMLYDDFSSLFGEDEATKGVKVKVDWAHKNAPVQRSIGTAALDGRHNVYHLSLSPAEGKELPANLSKTMRIYAPRVVEREEGMPATGDEVEVEDVTWQYLDKGDGSAPMWIQMTGRDSDVTDAEAVEKYYKNRDNHPKTFKKVTTAWTEMMDNKRGVGGKAIKMGTKVTHDDQVYIKLEDGNWQVDEPDGWTAQRGKTKEWTTIENIAREKAGLPVESPKPKRTQPRVGDKVSANTKTYVYDTTVHNGERIGLWKVEGGSASDNVSKVTDAEGFEYITNKWSDSTAIEESLGRKGTLLTESQLRAHVRTVLLKIR